MQIRNKGRNDAQNHPNSPLWWIVLLAILSLLSLAATLHGTECPARHLRNGEALDNLCRFFHIAMTPEGRWIELQKNNVWVPVEFVDCTKATRTPPESQRYYVAHSIQARFWCPETHETKAAVLLK